MSTPPIPPVGSAIRVEPLPEGGWVIVWPRLEAVWLVVNTALGALLIGFGVRFLAGSTGPPLVRYGFGALLALAGLHVVWRTFVARFAPEHLELADGELRHYRRWRRAERTTRFRSVRLDRLTEVALRASTAKDHSPKASKEQRGYELVVRTDATLWILGRDLDDRDLRWLARTVEGLVGD